MYIVEALRWGDRENHSYVVGVFSTLENAKLAALAEEMWRGGNKYECIIDWYDVDYSDDYDPADLLIILNKNFTPEELKKHLNDREFREF